MTENLRTAFGKQPELSFEAMTQGQTRWDFRVSVLVSLCFVFVFVLSILSIFIAASAQDDLRRVAAACLFELLVLATDGAIKVVQEEPYEDIAITATKLFPSTAA
jgi:hypothetical protein